VSYDARIQRVADAYPSMLHWPLEGRDRAVFGPNAPTAGPPSYAAFEVKPTTVVGLPGIAGTEKERTQPARSPPTRWRF
jgi:hypothetical protein